MRHLRLYVLLTFSPLLVFSQVKVDSTYSSPTSYYLSGTTYNGENIGVLADGVKADLNFYNDSLQLMKSVGLPSTGPDSLFMDFTFKFNDKLYIKAYSRKWLDYTEYFYLYDAGLLKPVVTSDLDTLTHTSIVQAKMIDKNTLRLLGERRDTPTQPSPDQSVIIDLDSNFHVKTYHKFQFDSLTQFRNTLITNYHLVNDSIAHIYIRDGFIKYNLNKNTVDTAYYLRGAMVNTTNINQKEYLALGVMIFPDKRLDTLTPAPINGDDALGFYRMSTEGYPIDSTYIFHKIDTSHQSFITSFLRIGYNGTSIQDTDNIYMAADADFIPIGTGGNSNSYAWIIKVNSRGNEIWRFDFTSPNKSFVLRNVTATDDGGCVAFGFYGYRSGPLKTVAFRIKLGPDGTMSNLEILAPESFVQFYPNPVKNILHYSYLQPAKGNYHLNVYDMKGTKVAEHLLPQNNSSVQIDLKSGFYLYHLLNENGKNIQVGKVIVE